MEEAVQQILAYIDENNLHRIMSISNARKLLAEVGLDTFSPSLYRNAFIRDKRGREAVVVVTAEILDYVTDNIVPGYESSLPVDPNNRSRKDYDAAYKKATSTLSGFSG